MNRLLSMAAGAAAMCCIGSAHAATVFYDSGVSAGTATNAFQSDPDAGLTIADDFFLIQDAEIEGILFSGIYLSDNSPGTDAFSVTIYEDDGGAPGATAETVGVSGVTRSDSGSDLTAGVSADIYSYEMDVVDFTLDAGSYFLSIVNDTTSDADDDWYWATTGVASAFYASFDSGSSWTDLGGANASFALQGTLTISNQPLPGVPVPAAAPLLLGALGLIAALVRRRRG